MLFPDNNVKKSIFFFTEGPSPLKSMNSTAYSKVSMRQLTMNELLQSVKQSYYHEVLSYPNKDGRYLRQSLEQAVDIAADLIAASECHHPIPPPCQSSSRGSERETSAGG